MPQKNHAFVVQIAAEVIRRAPHAHFLLLGDGPLRPSVEQQVSQAGLSEYVVFAGSRPDVPRLMLGAMDVFVFPSLYEGLPLTLLEVQAAGLPSVISNVISEETDTIKPLLSRLSLTQPPIAWAESLLALSEGEPAVSREAALDIMEQSPFNIQVSVEKLSQFYFQATVISDRLSTVGFAADPSKVRKA
jgi:glycosyltransferase involved in cell wall biosynthesis